MITVILEQLDQRGDHTKQRYMMDDLYFEIGRDPNCDLVIPSAYDYVSNRHLSVTIKSGQVVLQHLGSNQSYINDDPIGKHNVAQNKDIIKLTSIGPSFKVLIHRNEKFSLLQYLKTPYGIIAACVVLFLLLFTIYIYTS